MKAIQADLTRTIDYFIAEITELAHRAAIDTLEMTLHSRVADPASAVLATGRGRAAKRQPAELQKVAQLLLRFVRQHPGLRVEQINTRLRTTTKDLALPIRKLLAEGSLLTEGQARSTKYFAEPMRRLKKPALRAS